MALSAQEEMQIRKIVDDVVQARLEEAVVVQARFVAERLLEMTDHYVEALMRLTRAMGLPDSAAKQEGDRMAELMLQGLRR